MTRRRILRVGAVFAVAALIWSGFEIASLADMTVTQEVTTTVGDEKTTFTQTIYCTKSRLRTADPSGMVSIIDVGKSMMIILDTKTKSYTEHTFEQMRKRQALLPAEMRKMKLSVRETGDKKTIDRYPCEKLVFKVGPTEIAVWITEKITIDPDTMEFNRKFLELTKDISGVNIQGHMRAEFEKRKAYPYLTVIEIALPFVGKTRRTEARVKKVSYQRIEPSVFAVPDEYKKQTLPAMPAAK